MIGAILGDIAGSDIEYVKPVGFDYRTAPMFNENKFITDDTIMTIATKYAIDNDISFTKSYQMFGRKFSDSKYGYGGSFLKWIYEPFPKPYNSYGNGSAMRISYIGEKFNSLEEVEKWAIESAKCTHNHIEGIKGAVATAQTIYIARKGYTKKQIKDFVESNFKYNINLSLDEIRPNYRYDVTCQGTVPVAIRCFLESESYEDCIRNVFSLNGDVDTMGCIAGSIAENYYGSTGFNNYEILSNYCNKYLLDIVYSQGE